MSDLDCAGVRQGISDHIRPSRERHSKHRTTWMESFDSRIQLQNLHLSDYDKTGNKVAEGTKEGGMQEREKEKYPARKPRYFLDM